MDKRLAAFNLFTEVRREELQKLANFTNGEQEFNDIASQAWIIADEMIKAGATTGMEDTRFQDLLLQKLRRHFDDNFSFMRRRRTTRLDMNEYDDGPLRPHSLVRKLISDAPDPLTCVIDQEESEEVEEEAEPGEVEVERVHSLAGAYGKLLDFFERNIQKLAEHLRISTARARRNCDYARLLAFYQRPLPCPLPGDFMPGPWLMYTPQRRAMQLMLEFSYQLEFDY
jgi:hypothetical protein